MATATCAHCGTTVPANLHFCPKCDKPVPSQQPADALSTATAQRAGPTQFVTKHTGVSSGTALFVVASALLGLAGWNWVSQATLGVAAIATGILFAVWARLIQSSAQHLQMVDVLKSQATKPPAQ